MTWRKLGVLALAFIVGALISFMIEGCATTAAEATLCREPVVDPRLTPVKPGDVFDAADGCNRCTYVGQGVALCTLLACVSPVRLCIDGAGNLVGCE